MKPKKKRKSLKRNRIAFRMELLGHRVSVVIQKTAPGWVDKEDRNIDGGFNVTRADGLNIWVQSNADLMLLEDVFLHECCHAVWHILKEYKDEGCWSESCTDGLVMAHWEIEKGLGKIREAYGKA